jgi:hypothetical protein
LQLQFLILNLRFQNMIQLHMSLLVLQRVGMMMMRERGARVIEYINKFKRTNYLQKC